MLLAGAGVMGLAAVIALGALFSYRTGRDTRGLRIVLRSPAALHEWRVRSGCA